MLTKLSVRYITKGRARTMTTFGGVVLATFLITTVILIAYSISQSMEESNKLRYGDWHIALLEGNDVERREFIKEFNDEYIGRISILGFSTTNFFNDKEDVICVYEADNNWFNIMKFELENGRMPQKKGEIIVSNRFYNEVLIGSENNVGKIVVSDRLDEDGNRLSELVGCYEGEIWENKGEFEYKIVGIYNDTKQGNVGDVLYYSFYTYSKLNDDSRLYVRMENPDDVYKKGEKISMDACIYNKELLSSIGISTFGENSRQLLIYIVLISLIIVIISTVLLIGNAFISSFDERVKQVGLMMSLGMSKKQVFIMIILECILISVVAIPVGMIISIFVSYLIVSCYGNYLSSMVYAILNFKLCISLEILIIIFAVSLITIIIAALYPANVASKVDIIDAIRQKNDSKLMNADNKKCTCIEDVIVKRNYVKYRKKYLVARISLVISIILIVVSEMVCHYSSNIIDKTTCEYDVKVTLYDKTIEEYETIFERNIRQNKYVSRSSWMLESDEFYYNFSNVDYSNVANSYFDNELTDVGVKYLILDDEYFSEISTDISKVYYWDLLIASYIEKDEYVEKKEAWFNKNEIMEDYIIGDNIQKLFPLSNENKKILEQYYEYSGITIVMSFSKAVDILDDREFAFSGYINADNHSYLAEELTKKTSYNVMDVAKDYEIQKSNSVAMMLISRGFSGFIWGFSCINTIFTIITNVANRKKEFAIMISLGMGSKNLRKIFVKECIINLVNVSVWGYGISLMVSAMMCNIIDNAGFYFPISTTICSLIINFVLYFMAYYISYVKMSNMLIAKELKYE